MTRIRDMEGMSNRVAIIPRKTRYGTRYMALYRNIDGRQYSAGTFAHEKLAKAAYLEAKALVLRGIDPTLKAETVFPGDRKGAITVAAFTERWIRDHRVTDRTRYNYMVHLNNRILPRFGAEPVGSVTTHDVAVFLRKLEADEVPHPTVTHVRVVMSAMFQAAAEDGLIAVNPVRGVKLRKAGIRRRRVFSLEEYKVFRDCLPEHYRLLCDYMTQSGVRWEEAMGLRRQDIEGNVVTVGGVLAELPSPHRFEYTPRTKTGKVRQIKIPMALAARLFERAGDDGFIFRTPTGRHIPAMYFRMKVWRPALEKAGLPVELVPRDMRRTHATWLRLGGAEVEEVRNRLGHSTIAVTDRYLGEIKSTEDGALAAMENILGG